MHINSKTLIDMESVVGDSWYILDIGKFEQNYEDFLDAFQRIYPNVLVAYSYKTNYTPLLCHTINELGGYAEVVSEMEYLLALDLKVPASKIIINGPCKSYVDIERYLLQGSLVNLDSIREIRIVEDIALHNPSKQLRVGIRCNFEITEQPYSRFGIDITHPGFYPTLWQLAAHDNVVIDCIHCHFPYRDLITFRERVEKLVLVYKEFLSFCNPSFIDIGGGQGGNVSVKLIESLSLNPIEYRDYAEAISNIMQKSFTGIKQPCMVLEPGTALVADALCYVCKVIDIKRIRGHMVALTSGSKVNYQSRTSNICMPISIFEGHEAEREYFDSIDISGYTCMEEDYLYKGYKGSLGVGDYVMVENVGSYSVVFKPPFILPNVSIISLIDGEIHIIKNRETYKDVFTTYNLP